MSNDMPDVIYAVDFGDWYDDRFSWSDDPDWHDEYEAKGKYYSESHVQQLIKEAEKRQREKDAQICESQIQDPECPERAQYCADAIRNAGGE